MPDGLILSDILTRRLDLQWFEGIAVVRAVVERLVEHQGAAGIPELHQIDLLPDGSVALTGGAAVPDPVRRLGQLLQAMLTDVEAPVQLRLIVSQATAPIPSYPSLADLDQALAYFERPDRAGLLQRLVARAEAAGAMTPADAAPTLDRVAPLPEATPADPARHRNRMTARRRFMLAAAVIGLIVVSGAATLYFRPGGLALKGRTVSRATVAAADAVGAVVLAGVSAVSDRVGLGRLVADNAANAEAEPAAALTPAPKPRARVSGPAATSLDQVGTGPESLPPGTSLADEAPDGNASQPDTPLQPSDGHSASADAPFDSEIYTASSDGVSPPIGIRPQLPRQLSPLADPAKLSRIELLIDRDGTVESARLIGGGRDVRGGMLLSAAKTWQFGPAIRNGIAVRYRKTILVSFD